MNRLIERMSPEQGTTALAQDRERLENLASAALRSGRADEAEQALRNLLQAWPSATGYWLQLASLLERSNRREEAATCYRDLIERQPDVAVVRFNYACFLRRRGETDEALRQHQRALDLKIEQPEEVLSNMAVILGERHRHEEARNCLQRALNLNSSYIPALYNLALLQEEFGDRRGALALFNRILEIDPTYYNALVRITHARHIDDAEDPVVKKLRRALRHTNVDGLTRESLEFALGKALDDCGQYEEAFEHFERGNRIKSARLPPYDRASEEQRTGEIIEAFSPEWLAAVEPVSTRKLAFITGMFRSGSTLFEQVLAAHPQVTPGGEIEYFGQLLQKSQSPAEAAAASFPASLAKLDFARRQQIADGYLEYLDHRYPASTLVTNKRPEIVSLMGFIAGLFPNAVFVHTVRDPLDTCLSIYLHQLDSRFSYAADLGNIAHRHRQYQRLVAHWNPVIGPRIFAASYDEYVIEPERVTRALLDFLGLEWHPGCLEPQKSAKRVRTESLWQVREAVYRKSSGRWRNYERQLAPARQILEGG